MLLSLQARNPNVVQLVNCIHLALNVAPLRHTSIFTTVESAQCYLASLILVIQGSSFAIPEQAQDHHCHQNLPHIMVRLAFHRRALSTGVLLIAQYDMLKCQATGIKNSKVFHG